jgi:phage terminase Nu1 subunit (DNA packaging protein)
MRVTEKADKTPLLVTRVRLAGVFGKEPRTIARWLEDGLPVAQPGRPGKAALFDVGVCVQWVIQREVAAVVGDGEGLSPQHQRALLDRKRTEELELRIQVKRGALVPAEDVARDFADCATSVKARLRRVPSSVADRVVAIASQGPHAIKALLLGEIDEALRELSTQADVDKGAA